MEPVRMLQSGSKSRGVKTKVVLRLNLQNARDRSKALRKAVEIPGVVSAQLNDQNLIVVGDVNPVDITKKLRKSFGMVKIISVGHCLDEKEEVKATEGEEAVQSTVIKFAEVGNMHRNDAVPEEILCCIKLSKEILYLYLDVGEYSLSNPIDPK